MTQNHTQSGYKKDSAIIIFYFRPTPVKKTNVKVKDKSQRAAIERVLVTDFSRNYD